MRCCTPQDERPDAAASANAAGAEGDPATHDVPEFGEQCVEMFSRGVPACCAALHKRVTADAVAEGDEV
jgi:hypothetical protein